MQNFGVQTRPIMGNTKLANWLTLIFFLGGLKFQLLLNH